MRIASWNVDSIRARMSLVRAWVGTHKPDVLCLQETKVADRGFPSSAFRAAGYDVVTAGDGGHGGVAMLARRDVRDAEVGDPVFGDSVLSDVVLGIPGAKPPLAERRTISATVDGLRIHTVYAPNGRKAGTTHHRVKLAWLELFRAWIQMDGLDGDTPTLVIGDLNVAPADIDIWEPGRYRGRNLTSPAEREAFDGFLRSGLVDVMRQQNPDVALFTWWNRRSGFYETDRGWRLDHALADSTTAARVTSAWVDRSERGRPGSSDHAPIVIDLD